jgi:hypothetical protein
MMERKARDNSSDSSKTYSRSDDALTSKNSVKRKGEGSDRVMATIQDDDERLLARIGYRQVRRMTG